MDKKVCRLCMLPLLLSAFEASPQAYLVEEIPGYAQRINKNGQVVGYWAGVAFIWSPETGAVNLPSVAGGAALGLGLNNTGGAVGSVVFAGQEPVYCPAKWLGDSVEFPWGCSRSSYAYGINDRGQIVGIDEQGTAIRVDTDGSIIRIGVPESVGFAINSAGQWVGRYRTASGVDQAFRYSDGKGVEDLPPLRPGFSGVAVGVNEVGDCVGTAFVGNRWDVTAWRRGTVENLSANSPYPTNVGFGINSKGVVVGASSTTLSFAYDHAFVITAADGFQDLTDLIGDPQWVFDRASGINEAGQIVGSGRHNGQVAGFRLTPVGD